VKVVINVCYGGASLSDKAMALLKERAPARDWDFYNIPLDRRTDPELVRVVEELGGAADGAHAKLKVVEIPDGVEFDIDEYDGIESIHERHQSWR
jgi:hypothetical protein